jgi:protein SCO1/2
MPQQLCVFLLMSCLGVAPTWAYEPGKTAAPLSDQTPRELEGIGIDEHLGQTLNLDIPFNDEQDHAVRLGQYFGTKPVLLDIVYFDCPSLCSYHLNGVLATLKQIDWTVGNQFDVVAVSMDQREKAPLALAKKQAYAQEYGRANSAAGFHFLTGTEENVRKLALQVGFRFRWDEQQKQFAHASVAYIVTPQKQISRYLYGLEFSPRTVRLSLIEAASGKIGTFVDQLILFCFHYDPSQSKYVLYAFNVMRAGALLILAVLGLIIVPAWRREKRRLRAALKGEG